ncbi:MAG: HNH endonuclease [Candidatus Bathyarchaeota archaeon]|nr:HNH endonuclease [Candidatus Bathyarchaeota archaeon]MDH5494963.1 HNH endonuclease [Candidatus Bathyarchaeota archaeon]
MDRKKDFPESVKTKCLLWSDRHCCLCDKRCGTDIEVHHIEEGKNDIENAIPLCYSCHAAIHHYNSMEPMGNRFRPKELKSGRDQIYEKYTCHLVPPIDFEVTQNIRDTPIKRKFPDIGFNIHHRGISHPVRAKIEARVKLDDKVLGMLKAHYNGSKKWNLNPLQKFYGHTSSLPKKAVEAVKDKGRLQIDVRVTIIDRYEREHRLLPVGYVYMPDKNSWFAEPSVSW